MFGGKLIKKIGGFVKKMQMPLLVTLLLAVSCLLSAFIFASKNNVTKTTVAISSEQTNWKINEEDALTINVNNNDASKKISAVRKIVTKNENERDWKDAPASVYGGTTFSFVWDNENNIPKIVIFLEMVLNISMALIIMMALGINLQFL